MHNDYDKIDDRTLALRQRGIRPIPDEERLDVSRFPRNSLRSDLRRAMRWQEYVR